MSQQSGEVLRRLLLANNLGWVLEIFGPSDRFLPIWIDQLNQAAAEYRTRFGVSVSFAPETLEAEAAKNPHKIRAFLQAFCVASSPAMLVMVWRILQGLKIQEIKMAYHERKSFELIVVLAPPWTNQEQLEEYKSQDIRDANLLRHFGTGSIDGRPLIHGFYTLQHWDKPVTQETAAVHSP
jgi:hypothetical protein